jgi:predicted PurR-regulated permease PerM
MWPGGSPAAVNGAAGLTIVALIIAALYAGRDLLIPFAFAGLLSLVLAPLLRRLIGWRVPRGVAVAFIIFGVVAGLAIVVTLAGRQVAQLVEEVPSYEQTLRNKTALIHSWVGGPGIWQRALATLRNVAEEVRDPGNETKPVPIEVAQESAQPITVALDYLRSALPTLETSVLAVMFTMFILLQYGDLRDRLVRIMGVREIGRSTQALSEAGSDLSRFSLVGLLDLPRLVAGICRTLTGVCVFLALSEGLIRVCHLISPVQSALFVPTGVM